jgi:hypothetical protein
VSELLSAFLEDVSVTLDTYTELAARGLENPEVDEVRLSDVGPAFHRVSEMIAASENPTAAADVVAVVRHCVLGALHSVLVTLDNGSMTSDEGTVKLVDAEDGRSLIGTGAYHEAFLDHLDETGRI